MQWAYVEIHLGLIFHAVHEAPRVATDLIWGRIRSFDAKVQVLHDAMSAKLTDKEMRREWTLLREATMQMYAKRNQVAHSTPVLGPNGKIVIEPFSQIYATGQKSLNSDDLAAFGAEFMELSHALLLMHQKIRGETPHPQATALADGLIRRLREADDLKREAQRHRAEAWRQYQARNPHLKF